MDKAYLEQVHVSAREQFYVFSGDFGKEVYCGH
jgi:hypothetical protein